MSIVHFEGPEKKVELVLRGAPNLRALPASTWSDVVEAAGACILSHLSGERVDAYLLSESSLFVWDNRVAMLTCGRTHLVDAIVRMLEFIPKDSIEMLVYERKNEHFPERQPSTFVDDARRIREILPGTALRFGAEHEHRVMLFHTDAPYCPADEDLTLEILMHGIDPRWLEANLADGDDGRVLRARAADLLPGFRVDDYVFEPTGYSLNALRGNRYYTIHVTPQTVGSYVSFETNADFKADLQGIVRRVVALFTPEAFDVVTFAPEGALLPAYSVEGCQQRKHVEELFSGFRVSFRHFFMPNAGPIRAQPVNLG